jgi:hypothetical protein
MTYLIPSNLRHLYESIVHFGSATPACGSSGILSLWLLPYLATHHRPSPFEIDHIVPEAHGGTSDEENLWLACPMCNSHKADRQEAVDPESQGTVPLFNPRAERWDEHFEWVEAGAIIRGKTPKGRATVTALQMNHPDIVAARRLWVIAGWHPPAEETINH